MYRIQKCSNTLFMASSVFNQPHDKSDVNYTAYLCCHQTRASRHLRSPSTHTNVARTRRLSCRQRHLKILYVCHILHIQRCCHYCPPNAVQSQNIPDNKRTLYFYHLHSDSISRWYVFSSFRYFMSGCGCSTT